MTMLEAVLMGILQGLTEFLPVSSSGHLVIGEKLLGISQTGILLEVALHLGTLVAVCIFFWRQIKAMIDALGAWLLRKTTTNVALQQQRSQSLKLFVCIIVACIPTAIIGLFLEQYSATLFSSTKLVGALLLVTGIILWVTPRKINFSVKPLTAKRSLIIGLVQGLAVLPGISRSGSTIATSLLLGVSREDAAKFSFLISVPAILGATLLEALKLKSTGISADLLPALIGAVVAGVSGYMALKFLITILNQGRLWYFAFYCWALGLVTLIFI